MSQTNGSPVTPPTRHQVHDLVSRAASSNGGLTGRSSFNNGVSLHRMSESVSFTSAKKIVDACKDHEDRMYLGTIDGSMVVSVNFNHDPPSLSSATGPTKKKKRQRDPHEEAADHAVERVKRGLSVESGLTEELLQHARVAVHGLLTAVKGAHGESVIESYGLSFKAPEGGTVATNPTAAHPPSSRPRLILSARIAPGVAVPLKMLFAALGTKCCQDGMFTVQDSSTLATGFNLPLSEQAQAAVSHGQKAVSLFATVSQ